jgi:creatinine amidohydrolase/Fe(II)-dependent formamide hydrolase-like protein
VGVHAFLAAVLLALLAVPSARSGSDSRFLEELTTTEVRARIRAGETTVLVPVGGTEQNGAHMALGKHNVRVRALAGRIAARLGNALVAPVVAYVPEGAIDPPSGHMRHAGTISIPASAFEATLEAAARSLQRHGFNEVVFLGDSGDYRKNLHAVAARLNRAGSAGRARVHAIDEYYRAAAIAEHAGAADTSLMLAIDPALVRSEGLPAGTSAEQGRAIAERIVEQSVDAIRKAVAQR